ncbi:MAG: hypothetical protein UDL61_09505, partial [Ruminococcus callidus]|uniref:hypothetical protein n=1 Tax=Ruminococcus callidus TaxID=40519 RepID=UPI002E7611D4
ISVQSAEKSDYASYAQALCSVSFTALLHYHKKHFYYNMVFPVCQPDFTCEKKEFINISYQKRKKSENTGKPLAFFANFDYNRKELRISNKSHVSTGLTERKFTYEKNNKSNRTSGSKHDAGSISDGMRHSCQHCVQCR